MNKLYRSIQLSVLILLFSLNSRAEQLLEYTPTYMELIEMYKKLEASGPYGRLISYGTSDNGSPMYLFVMTKDQVFNPESQREKGHLIYFINNGIHPGEPDGINASLLFARELLKDNAKKLPEKIAICIVPLMNVDGAMNRACCSRANQNGPENYGFRGNDLNLDLNRDFMKTDARTTNSWIKMYHHWDPDVLIDTHVSNGADYPYTMTMISSQKDKLYPILGGFMNDKFTPLLFKKMKQAGEEMCPYVHTIDPEGIPDKGIVAFLETPRYLTGHSTLFNTFSFIAETHMLKAFPSRVKATETLFNVLLESCVELRIAILEKRNAAKEDNKHRSQFPVNWKLDTTVNRKIEFQSYEAKYKTSSVTGLSRLYYDSSRINKQKINFYDSYFAQDTLEAPAYYVVPQAFMKVIQLIHLNNIKFTTLRFDTVARAEVYYIDTFSTISYPYEGHYLHSITKVRSEFQTVQLRKGDWLIPVNQVGNRYLIEALEPRAMDSYFNWGFFDAFLQQKEWFSSYVFEEEAEKLLRENPELKQRLELKKTEDEQFAKDGFAQLLFIYRASKYFEKSYMRYPIYRIPR